MKVLTKEEFAALSPKSRGYAVYMAGCRPDQPNIPDESNPYPVGSSEYEQWNLGEQQAIIECYDCVE